MLEMTEERCDRGTAILEALRMRPRSREVLARGGMTCVDRAGARMESVEQGAYLREPDVDGLFREPNRLEEDAG
jgi:hypothetical protein